MNRKQNQVGTAVRSALVTCAIAATVAVVAPIATASVVSNGTGGTLCKAASGPGADVFYFSNLSAENISDSLQYLSCGFNSDINDANEPVATAQALNVAVYNTTDAVATFTCVVQTGNEGFGVRNTAVYSLDVAANDFDFIYSDENEVPAMPAPSNRFSPYTLSCAVPGGGKVGLINFWTKYNINPPT